MEKITPKYASYWWGGYFLYLGRFDDITEHGHHALQLILNREGLFQFSMNGSIIECGGAIIAPDCSHRLLSSNDSQIHVWIERESSVARAIAKQHLAKESVKILEGTLLQNMRGCIDSPGNFLGSCEKAHDLYKKLVSELDGYSRQAEEAVDPRIQAVLNLLREKLLLEKVTIAQLARHACLSESRLIHLFTKQIGIPLRRYVLWQRVLTAMRLIAHGKLSLTEAAHHAGFADSAHLSRTYRSMFGLTLSHCFNISRFVQVNSCFS
jgi:AraC-like DNA-binding protein